MMFSDACHNFPIFPVPTSNSLTTTVWQRFGSTSVLSFLSAWVRCDQEASKIPEDRQLSERFQQNTPQRIDFSWRDALTESPHGDVSGTFASIIWWFSRLKRWRWWVPLPCSMSSHPSWHLPNSNLAGTSWQFHVFSSGAYNTYPSWNQYMLISSTRCHAEPMYITVNVRLMPHDSYIHKPPILMSTMW